MNLSNLAALVVGPALNTALRLDPLAQCDVQHLVGRTLALEITGLGIELYLTPRNSGDLEVSARPANPPACVIRATPFSLARMSVTPRQEELVFGGDVQVTGDLELARHFGDLMRQLNPDWEELLARVTGDVVAQKLGALLRSGHQWRQQAVANLRQDCSEYLREEARHLPTRFELDDFLAAVDALRSDADRLQSRVQRLQHQLGSQP